MPKHKNATLSINLPVYPKTDNIPLGSACLIWVVDRFNEDEWYDFKKDELVDANQNHAAYLSAEAAMLDVRKDVEQEIEENNADEQPDMFVESEKFNWEKEKTGDGTFYHILQVKWDGSIYTVRPIPLYLKGTEP